MADDVELIYVASETIRIERLKFHGKKQYKSWSMAKICSLFSQQGRENLNLLPLECQKTSEHESTNTKYWAQETKRNSQSNKMYYLH